jgi:hypothetical protein
MKPIITGSRGSHALAVNVMASMGLAPRESVIIHEGDGGTFSNGRVLAYNAGLFEGANPSEFLTNYAVRYTDPHEGSLDSIRQFIAPDVSSGGSQFIQYAVYDFGDAMKSLDNLGDDIRAIGADFNTLRNPTKVLATAKIPNRGLAIEVDEDEERLDADWQQRKVALLRGILDRNRLRRAIALAVAGAVSVSKVWSKTAGVDPDQDIMTELDAQSLRSSRIIYGPGAWSLRMGSHRSQNTAGGFASAQMSPEELAGQFAIEAVKVVRARYGTGGTATSAIVGNYALACIAADNLGKDDISNVKTFWAPTKAGGRYATYIRQIGDKRWRIGVECYDLTALTSVVGLEVVNVSAS